MLILSLYSHLILLSSLQSFSILLTNISFTEVYFHCVIRKYDFTICNGNTFCRDTQCKHVSIKDILVKKMEKSGGEHRKHGFKHRLGPTGWTAGLKGPCDCFL